MTEAIAIKPLEKDDARAFVESINKGLGDIRAMLISLHDGQGWKALGHKSWEACVKKEFGWDRTYAHRQITGGRIEQKLIEHTKKTLPIGNVPPPVSTIPESHLRPLASLPEDQQIAAYTDAKEEAAGEPLTARDVKAKVDLYKADNEPYVEPEEPPEEDDAPEPTVDKKKARKLVGQLVRELDGLGIKWGKLTLQQIKNELK